MPQCDLYFLGHSCRQGAVADSFDSPVRPAGHRRANLSGGVVIVNRRFDFAFAGMYVS